MDVPQAALVLHRLGALARLVEVAAALDDVGAGRAGGLVLLWGVADRHDNRARDALPLTRQRNRLAVIAGARRDDAAALAGRQTANQIEPAADLEGAGGVVVLVFDEDVEPA